MALALVSQPERFEQWAFWGHVPAEKLHGKIQRLGINFGAPGDRMTEAEEVRMLRKELLEPWGWGAALAYYIIYCI